MKIHNLYTDEKGESHFRDIEIDWIEERRGSKLSKKLPATGVIFRETQAEHNVTWHPAPRRQYIVNLDAGVKITASDGESRLSPRVRSFWSRIRTAKAISQTISRTRSATRSSSRSNSPPSV